MAEEGLGNNNKLGSGPNILSRKHSFLVLLLHWATCEGLYAGSPCLGVSMCSSLGGKGKCASNLPPHLKQVYADQAMSTNLNLALISLGVFDQRHCILITPSWLFQPWLQSLVREDIKETLYHTHPYHSCDFENVHTCCSQFILAFSSSTLRFVLKITFCGTKSQKWLASYV